MRNLFADIPAILRRLLPTNKPLDAAAEPRPFRPRQVRPAPEPRIQLRILSPAERRRFGPAIAASLGTVVLAGFIAPAQAQGEETCAFVYSIRTPDIVERALAQFPNDPCIPALLEAIPSHVLRRVDVHLIANLPASQLRKVSADVLAELGINASAPPPSGNTRAVPRTTYRQQTRGAY